MSPLFVAGALLFMSGGITWLVVLFRYGGAARSRQLAVLSDLFAGRAGPGPRAAMLIAAGLVVAGAATLFAAVGQADRARAERCRATCTGRGYASGAIGPSLDRAPDRRFVACTCSGGAEPPLELRADSLP